MCCMIIYIYTYMMCIGEKTFPAKKTAEKCKVVGKKKKKVRIFIFVFDHAFVYKVGRQSLHGTLFFLVHAENKR